MSFVNTFSPYVMSKKKTTKSVLSNVFVFVEDTHSCIIDTTMINKINICYN